MKMLFEAGCRIAAAVKNDDKPHFGEKQSSLSISDWKQGTLFVFIPDTN